MTKKAFNDKIEGMKVDIKDGVFVNTFKIGTDMFGSYNEEVRVFQQLSDITRRTVNPLDNMESLAIAKARLYQM